MTERMSRETYRMLHGVSTTASAPAKKPSKYRNVRVEVDGISFDSKKEAHCWLQLKAREQAGEIVNLVRQWPYDLMAPDRMNMTGLNVTVARYVADFVYMDKDTGVVHVVDVKSPATKKKEIYRLKRKWLELQSGIEIEEV